MELPNSVAQYRDAMNYNASNEVLYEDDEADASIPALQARSFSMLFDWAVYDYSE